MGRRLLHGVTFPMNSGNVILATVGLVLTGFFFMLTDATAPRPASRAMEDTQVRYAIAPGQPVLLEFYADWCGPCRAVAPVVEELAGEMEGQAKVIRLNVDEHQALASQYGVRAIPVFISLKHGQEASRQVGAIDKNTMRAMLGL